MLVISAEKCVYDESDKMFHVDADTVGFDLLDPPRNIDLEDDGVVKLRFSRVVSGPGNVLYHGFYLAPGEYYGTIPMKQYYLVVE